jgi:hypothetical protein
MLNGNKPQASPGAEGGALLYRGAWNANTNTPALASGVGTVGDYYIVSVAGTTNLDGIAVWNVSDWAVFNGSTWQKLDNANNLHGPSSSTAKSIARFTSTDGKNVVDSSITVLDDGSTTFNLDDNSIQLGNVDVGILGELPIFRFSSPNCPLEAHMGGFNGYLIINRELESALNPSLVFADTSSSGFSVASLGFESTQQSGNDQQNLNITCDNVTIIGHLNSYLDPEEDQPSAQAEAGAGAGAAIELEGTDLVGKITLTTGTVAGGDPAVLTVSFGYGFDFAPAVILTAANDNSSGKTYYVETSSSGFQIKAETLDSDVDYIWFYSVMGYKRYTPANSGAEEITIEDSLDGMELNSDEFGVEDVVTEDHVEGVEVEDGE